MDPRKFRKQKLPRDAAGPTRPGNRAEINANPSNLSSAMTKGRRRRAMDRGGHEKKRGRVSGSRLKGRKGREVDGFSTRCSQLGPISFSRCGVLFPPSLCLSFVLVFSFNIRPSCFVSLPLLFLVNLYDHFEFCNVRTLLSRFQLNLTSKSC